MELIKVYTATQTLPLRNKLKKKMNGPVCSVNIYFGSLLSLVVVVSRARPRVEKYVIFLQTSKLSFTSV
jgi:hypothetical protein